MPAFMIEAVIAVLHPELLHGEILAMPPILRRIGNLVPCGQVVIAKAMMHSDRTVLRGYLERVTGAGVSECMDGRALNREAIRCVY